MDIKWSSNIDSDRETETDGERRNCMNWFDEINEKSRKKTDAHTHRHRLIVNWGQNHAELSIERFFVRLSIFFRRHRRCFVSIVELTMWSTHSNILWCLRPFLHFIPFHPFDFGCASNEFIRNGKRTQENPKRKMKVRYKKQNMDCLTCINNRYCTFYRNTQIQIPMHNLFRLRCFFRWNISHPFSTDIESNNNQYMNVAFFCEFVSTMKQPKKKKTKNNKERKEGKKTTECEETTKKWWCEALWNELYVCCVSF